MTDQPTIPRPTATMPVPVSGAHHPALDAETHAGLADDPACEDAKLDIGVDETFPASDPVAGAMPRRGDEPPPSSGFRE